jgi:hypothetical protein
MAANKKNLKVCEIQHTPHLGSLTTYDVIIAIAETDEIDSVLQDWALATIGETLNLPEEMIYCKDITEVISSLDIDEFVYLQSAVSSYMDAPRYAGVSGDLPLFPVALSGGLYVLPACEAFLWSQAGGQGYFGKYTIPTKGLSITEGLNYIGIRFNSGQPEYIKYTDMTAFDYSSIIPLIIVLSFSGVLFLFPFGQSGDVLPEKLLQNDLDPKIKGAFTLSSASNYVSLSAVTVKKGVEETDCEAVVMSDPDNDMYLYYKDSSHVWQKSAVTVLNNTQYQSTGGLASLSPGDYVVNYIYRMINPDSKVLFSVLSGAFDSLADAKESEFVSDLPDVIKDTAVLVGRAIVVQASTSPVVQKVQYVNFGTVV